jgi:mono/diheme cytochrome c family protein
MFSFAFRLALRLTSIAPVSALGFALIAFCPMPSMIVHAGGVQTPKVAASANRPALRSTRSSEGDLEIGGELPGLSAGSVRYLRYEDLLALPQETFTVTDDSNFHGATEISGIALTELAGLFGDKAHSDLIAAICYDKYRAHYPNLYLSAHHPVLVLKINGQLRDKWPLSEYGGPLGPYLISHPSFKPSVSMAGLQEEPQIPFGVTRLDFRSESKVFGEILPDDKWRSNLMVMKGYRVARQDCFRCHNSNGEGGEKAGRSWLVLGAWAASDPKRFEQYIHNPKDIQPDAKMPAHGDYDQMTLDVLTAYFKTFVPERKTP